MDTYTSGGPPECPFVKVPFVGLMHCAGETCLTHSTRGLGLHSTRGLGLCTVPGNWAYAQYQGTGLTQY